MDWGSFANWALKALMAGVLAYGVHQLSEMRKSLDSLNKKMATMIEKTGWHEKTLDEHGLRIKALEPVVARVEQWLDNRKRK